MTLICIVRHGETDWNAQGKLQGKTDISLNQNGIVQANECKNTLSSNDWDLIITSPLKRAKETAEIINTEMKAPLIEMEDFIERSFGDAEGMTESERTTAFPDKNYSNQEDRISFSKRVIKGIEKINELYQGKKIILVAHGAVINAILTHFSNGEIGSGKTRLLNACMSNIVFIEEQWKIQDYNQIDHLSQFNKEGI
ncbi:histidine phosphatase family protein [Lysinibacillus fusiformis]|nr:histidine phosphatase family protein [Lysinibacillus fusiformis]